MSKRLWTSSCLHSLRLNKHDSSWMRNMLSSVADAMCSTNGRASTVLKEYHRLSTAEAGAGAGRAVVPSAEGSAFTTLVTMVSFTSSDSSHSRPSSPSIFSRALDTLCVCHGSELASTTLHKVVMKLVRGVAFRDEGVAACDSAKQLFVPLDDRHHARQRLSLCLSCHCKS